MLNNSKTIGIITRGGAVVMTTVISFAVYPPLLTGANNGGVNWNCLFIFFSGIFSILAYDQIRKKVKIKSLTYSLMILLFICSIGYQLVYNKYSINCYEKMRVVISDRPIKLSIRQDYSGWQKRSTNPLQKLEEACQCSSLSIWNLSDLVLPYYGMIILYFAIIVITTLLIVILSDQLNTSKLSSP